MGTQPSILRTLLGFVVLEPTNRSQVSCRRIFAVGSFSRLPSLENPHGFVIHAPLQGGSIRNRMSNLSDRLIVALPSDARDLDSGHTQKHRPSLGSPTSVLRLLAHKPSSLAIQNYNAAIFLHSRRKTLPSGATQKPQMGINLHAIRLYPKYIG